MVDVSSQNNSVSINVSSSGNSASIKASPDTAQYYSEKSREWAISNRIVDGVDYSSKYYAQQSGANAQKVVESENKVKEIYNTLLKESNSVSDEIREVGNETLTNIETVKNEAINSINSSKTTIINDIEFVADGEKKEIEDLIDNGKEELKESIGDVKVLTTLEIGDIGIAPLGIDETKGKRRYLNGQLIIQDQYVEFTKKVKSAVALYPSLACTESEWQTTVTMTVGGQVGKFVVDNGAGTIRLPKIIMPIQGLTDLSKLAEIVEAGLPNITGSFGSDGTTGSVVASGQVSGAFYNTATTSWTIAANKNIQGAKVGFDASRSSSIYGNSNTVQPESIQYPYFIQVATGAETEDNIINEIELNNPFSLLDYKYSEYELNNLSWLRSEGQYNSKAVYPAVYDLLLKIYNGTETKAGVSVKLSTETFTDYDFVLNTAEETFRLPVKVKQVGGGITGLYLYFYVGETVQNANLINAGRIEEKLADFIPNNSNLITNYCTPDYSNGIGLAITSNSFSYTCPSNGIITTKLYCTGNANAFVYINGKPALMANSGASAAATQLNGSVLVGKNDVVTISGAWSLDERYSYMYFYPMKGAK